MLSVLQLLTQGFRHTDIVSDNIKKSCSNTVKVQAKCGRFTSIFMYYVIHCREDNLVHFDKHVVNTVCFWQENWKTIDLQLGHEQEALAVIKLLKYTTHKKL